MQRAGAMGAVLEDGAEGRQKQGQEYVALGMGRWQGAMGGIMVAWDVSHWEYLTHKGSGPQVSKNCPETQTIASTHDTSHGYGPARDILTPETKDQCESSDFEGDQKGFINEEVPACHEAKRIIDEVTS